MASAVRSPTRNYFGIPFGDVFSLNIVVEALVMKRLNYSLHLALSHLESSSQRSNVKSSCIAGRRRTPIVVKGADSAVAAQAYSRARLHHSPRAGGSDKPQHGSLTASLRAKALRRFVRIMSCACQYELHPCLSIKATATNNTVKGP